jgi:KaiC/GvpD/RAD55 family RecA-like ATPase
MLPWLESQPGERNNTMTRFVGWAYSKGHDASSVLAMALGINTKWPEPLLPREIEAIVKSIGVREAARPQRATSTGAVLRIEGDEAPVPVSLHSMAYDQIEDAITEGRRDHSAAARFSWLDLDRLIGPLLPGYFVAIGALTGNGKTAFLLSQMEAWAARSTTVLYVPLELDPWELRRQWAAWTLGMDWLLVARNDWASLPPGAQQRHEAALAEQLANPHVHFPPDRRISVLDLAGWVDRAVKEVKAQVVVIDHFHRMDFGGANANYRVQVTEAARNLKDLARQHRIIVIASAQLNQDPHPCDRYFPPVLKRLKESAGISEETNVVLMLSRRLTKDLETDVVNSIRSGHQEVRQYEDPNVMVVTCRKHRLDDHARDRSVQLVVNGGRVVNMAPSWRDHVEDTRYGV